ncbi:MAG: TQO small subunit DoxD [bacterium]
MSNKANEIEDSVIYRYLGYAAIPLRLVLGWMFFSAAWRRVVLASGKLQPNSPLWVGHKFNTFLPHASNFMGVGNLIHLLILHPQGLAVFLNVFTVIEFLVGLSLIFGLFSRLGGLGAVALAFGILFGSGWLGATCLDEWQVGSVEMTVGLLILFAGASWSLDDVVRNIWPKTANTFIYRLIGNGPLWGKSFKTWTAIFAIFGIVVTMGTNQLFQGGVWGNLHNFGKKLMVSVTEAKIANDNLKFVVYRTGGSGAAFAYIIKAQVDNSAGKPVYIWNQNAIEKLPLKTIHNRYINRAFINKYSMVMQLGAKADISLPINKKTAKTIKAGNYRLVLTDVSGAEFSENFSYKG